jgi:hypothetical protein
MSPVRQLPVGVPTGDAKLFDVLHGWFGIGAYDEEDETPWWAWRMAMIGRIKASRKRRDTSIAELYVSALYCKAHNLNIEGIGWLYRHIPKAWAWWDGQLIDAVDTPTVQYAEAIRIEAANQDSTWLTRLLRASPACQEEVLAEWEQHLTA